MSALDELPAVVTITPRRGGPPRIKGDPRPAPGQVVALDLTTIRVPSRALVDLVDEITAHAPRVLISGGNSRVRAYLRASLYGRDPSRKLRP